MCVCVCDNESVYVCIQVGVCMSVCESVSKSA